MGRTVDVTYISEHHTAFLVDFQLIIVVDLEFRKQNLIFVSSQRALSCFSILTSGPSTQLTASSFSAVFASSPPI